LTSKIPPAFSLLRAYRREPETAESIGDYFIL